jgi:hypothetical protein
MKKENSYVIKPTPFLTEFIKLGCRVCRDGLGNRTQIVLLKSRKRYHPEESKAIDLIIEQCERCSRGEREVTISDQYSCAWTIGIPDNDNLKNERG